MTLINSTKPSHRIQQINGILIVALLTLPWLTSAVRSSTPRFETIDGIVHVKNPDTPKEGDEVWQLKKLWTRGDSEDDIIFGLIPRVISDSFGNIYVLDAQLHHVFVFDPAGNLINTLFQEGDGPGEIRAPRDVLFMPGGNIGVVQQYPGRIITVDQNGNPGNTITLEGSNPTKGGISVILSAQSCNDHIILSCMSQTFDNATQIRDNYIAGFKGNSEIIRYLEITNSLNFNRPVFSERIHHLDFMWNTVVDSLGRVYIAPHRDEYKIYVYAADGSIDRIIERHFSPRQRSREEIQRFQSIVETALRELNTSVEVEETDAVIDWRHRALWLAPDGNLWVLNSRGYNDQPSGIMATFDIFDSDGIYLKRIAFECDADGKKDALFFVGTDRVVVVKNFTEAMEGMLFQSGVTGTDENDAEPMSISCYEINSR